MAAPKPIAVTQRVDIVAKRGERRDALDQRWTEFLAACGLLAVPMPNRPEAAGALFDALFDAMAPAGLLLTGGNDPVAIGGDAPERDATEAALIERARACGLPVFGVCRGLQVLLARDGAVLKPVAGHVTAAHRVRIDGVPAEVNSYHIWGASEAPAGFEVWAVAEDGVIEAARHRRDPVAGIMWHPERTVPFAPRDIALFRHFFGTAP
jgi:putative glutamine amidotransferase